MRGTEVPEWIDRQSIGGARAIKSEANRTYAYDASASGLSYLPFDGSEEEEAPSSSGAGA